MHDFSCINAKDMRNMANTWKELRRELNLAAEDEATINFEKELIKTMIESREKQGLRWQLLPQKNKTVLR